MKCPLQNIKVIESLNRQTENKNQKQWNKDDGNSVMHDMDNKMTPSFTRFKSQEIPNIMNEPKTVNIYKEEEANISNSETDLNELEKYFTNNANVIHDDERNDYSYQLIQLKNKLIQIQEISQKEIVRLKQELEQQRTKNRQKIPVDSVSVGVNTEKDHRDEEIAILKEMLKQQCLVNKQLMKQSLKRNENIYQAIKITKN